MPICQGATDPSAVDTLARSISHVSIYHLPRLHAKLYVADASSAIVTSGNLTAGGLIKNYEDGVQIFDRLYVRRIRHDLMDYAELGASITRERLGVFCEIAEKVRRAF